VGRNADNELRIDHASVSRLHAELIGSDAGWRLRDLRSKNGSFVDGQPADDTALIGACWLRFGDVHCEFELLSEQALTAEEQGRHAAPRGRHAHTARLARMTGLAICWTKPAFGARALPMRARLRAARRRERRRGIARLPRAQCPRARPARPADRAFSGSVGAVRRALQERAPWSPTTSRTMPFFAGRASWSRTSSCAGMPAVVRRRPHPGRHLRRPDRRGPPITTLDIELLQAFAEHAAVWIAARRATDQLAQQADAAPRWSRIVAAQAEVA
jgi:hypothetical protein